MAISLNTILGALAGGAHGLGQGLDRQEARRRQAMLDEMQREQMASARERREYENMANVARMADDGIQPASAITDTVDYGPLMAQGAAVAGGTGVGVPSAKLPNPKKYAPVGTAGGQSFYYDPASTKEAKAVAAKDAARAAEVARMIGMKKPDGSPISQAEAEAIVDNNVHYSDFQPKRVDRLSPEGMAREEELIQYRTRAQSAAKAAAAKTGKTETREQREKYLAATAERLVNAAAAKHGGKGDERTVVNDALAEAHKTGAVGEGLTPSHLRAAYQSFSDRFTAKSKPAAPNPFLDPSFSAESTDVAPSAPARAPAKGGVESYEDWKRRKGLK